MLFKHIYHLLTSIIYQLIDRNEHTVCHRSLERRTEITEQPTLRGRNKIVWGHQLPVRYWKGCSEPESVPKAVEATELRMTERGPDEATDVTKQRRSEMVEATNWSSKYTRQLLTSITRSMKWVCRCWSNNTTVCQTFLTPESLGNPELTRTKMRTRECVRRDHWSNQSWRWQRE